MRHTDLKITSFRPIKYNNLNNKYLHEILNVIIHNSAFNIVYLKINNGKWWWVPSLSARDLTIKIFFLVFQISITLIKTIMSVFKYGSILDLLCMHALNVNDNRIIVKEDNLWHCNGKFKTFYAHLKPHVINLSDAMGDKHYKIMFNYYEKYSSVLNNQYLIQNYYQFVLKDHPKTPHLGSTHWTNSQKTIGYQTDYEKAHSQGYYDKTKIINKFQGTKKSSVLLEQQISDVKEVGKEKKKLIINEIMGAKEHGYDKNALNNTTVENINLLEKYDAELDAELSSHPELSNLGLSSKEYSQMIINDVCGILYVMD